MKTIGFWNKPASIQKNNFKMKSLSCWSYNIAVGCEHACQFCYVPSVSTNKLAKPLAERGVNDPDGGWGDYVFIRPWNQDVFLKSLRLADNTPLHMLNEDGNRAVMLCTTTDPYQVAGGNSRREVVRNALELILQESTINVRILTRSPLAREDFDLMKRFGNRLLFGMSIPTLDNRLARIYEPKAPAPSQRLATLKAAREAGLNVYVACAPIYPDCDVSDMDTLVNEIKQVDPVTIFMEPINIRAENVARIKAHAEIQGVLLKTEVFRNSETWRNYCIEQMKEFEDICADHSVHGKLHLWPDNFSLKGRIKENEWLQKWWGRISEWPE